MCHKTKNSAKNKKFSFRKAGKQETRKMTTWTPDLESYLRHLPIFEGRREQLEPFLEAVDYIIPAIAKLPTEAAYYYLQKIKIKIVGKARLILDLNSDIDNWDKAKNVLLKNFGEKRNLFTLTEELRSSKFQINAINFLNEIRFKLRNVISKCKNETNDAITVRRDIEFYRNLALRTFINGLPESLSTILHARNPSNLEDAETILCDTDNLYSRKDKGNNFSQNKRYNENRNVPNPQKQFNHNNKDLRPNFNKNNNNNFGRAPQNDFQNFRNNRDNFGQTFQKNNQNFGNNNNAFKRPNDFNSGQFRNNGLFGGSRQFRQPQNKPEPMDTSINTTSDMNMSQDFPINASETDNTPEYLIS